MHMLKNHFHHFKFTFMLLLHLPALFLLFLYLSRFCIFSPLEVWWEGKKANCIAVEIQLPGQLVSGALGNPLPCSSDTCCLCLWSRFAFCFSAHTGCSVKSSCLTHVWSRCITRIHIQHRNCSEPAQAEVGVLWHRLHLNFAFWRW